MSLFGVGVGRICGVAAARTAKEMARQVRAGLRQTRTIELRLDWLSSDAERAGFLRWLKSWIKRSNQPRATFLATCRRRIAGGKFPGDTNAELRWLKQAREAGCSWCDLEVETLRELPGKSVPKSVLPPRVLLSMHDFQRTSVLPSKFSRLAQSGVHAVKIAAMAQTIGDSVRLLRWARSSGHHVDRFAVTKSVDRFAVTKSVDRFAVTKSVVAVPMGDLGLPARIIALREGSALAYAPIGEATAPGQVALRELVHLYRAHSLTPRSRVYGVIGDPIGHSLSPLLHNTGIAARKLDAVYLPFLVHDLRDFLKAVPEFGLRGFSVTLPHKQAILKYLKECEPLAAEIGAVNTVVVREDGSLYGCNTDYLGVLRALHRKLRIAGSRVLILGAGGSARAAAFALARAGAAVGICARRESAAKQLARAVGGELVPRRALRSEFFDAIVNATPVGMYPQEGSSPLSPGELHCRMVMDLIYRPQRTQLLKLAKRQGLETVFGVKMFLAQGFAQWEIWNETRAPEAAMRRAVLSALRQEETYAAKRGPRRRRSGK